MERFPSNAESETKLSEEPFLDPSGAVYQLCGSPVGPVAGMRSFFLQALHPLAMAGVDAFSMYEGDPIARFERTSRYVETTFYGTRKEALEAGDIVQGLHKRVQGMDPVTGQRFSAMDPEPLLYVHCCEMESILEAYHQLWRPVSREVRDQFYAETVPVAELVGIPAEVVPSSDAEMRAYFKRMWPTLCSSQATARIVRHLVTADWQVPVHLKPLQKYWALVALSTLPEQALEICPPPTSEWKIQAAGKAGRALFRSLRVVWNDERFAQKIIRDARAESFADRWYKHGADGRRDLTPGEKTGCPFHGVGESG